MKLVGIIIVVLLASILGVLVYNQMDHRSDYEKAMERWNKSLCDTWRTFGNTQKLIENNCFKY